MQTSRQFPFFNGIHRILILQLGDIGDVVWSIPTFAAVRGAYPDAFLAVLVRRGFGDLIAADPAIQAVFEVPAGGLWQQIGFIRQLRRCRFDLVFDLRSDDRGAITALLTGAPCRASLYHTDVPFWRNALFTHLLIPADPPPADQERLIFGAAEQSLRIVRGFGIAAGTSTPRIQVAEPVLVQVRSILREAGVPEGPRWVTVNPFSRWVYKEWPAAAWIRVMDWLWASYGIASVVVGSALEGARAEEICRSCAGPVHNLAGKTTLGELAGVLSLSRLHLGVDSAAPHIAAAVGVPTVTLYGPSDWRDWAPVGPGHRVITADMDCAPCYRKGCDDGHWSRCMEALEVDSVEEVIREALVASEDGARLGPA